MKLGLLLLFLAWSPAGLETIPAVHTKSFADTQVDLPADLRGKSGVLVIGFSKQSSQQTKLWNALLLPEYSSDAGVAYYEGAVLADVPAFIRGFVLKQIRDPM